MFPLVCFSPLNVNWDEEQIPTRLQSRILSTAPLSCACKKKKKKKPSVYSVWSYYSVCGRDSSLRAVINLQLGPSPDTVRLLTQRRTRGKRKTAGMILWDKKVNCADKLLWKKKKKILLKEIILSEKLELLLQTSITSQNISKEI